MVQGVLRSQRLFPSRLLLLVAIGAATDLLHECLEFAKFLQQRLVGQGLDILGVVEYLSLLVARGSSSRFAGVHALEDAQPSKVLERDLQLLEDLRSPDECGIEAGVVLLPDLAHAREFAVRGHAGVDGGLDGLLLDSAFDSVAHD